MILERGVSNATLSDVTKDFEVLYQGTKEVNGLRDLEVPLVAKGLLVELNRRSSKGMAIVTGRPRKDCMHFLNLHGYI